jgi:hypothetical protein
MINPSIDLSLFTAQIQAQDAQGACYIKDLALINAEAFMRYVAPFVPKHLEQEFQRVSEDIEFALKVGSTDI